MTPEGQKSQWLCLTKLPREMYSQPIVHKALSWSVIRKYACIPAKITIRKSQLFFLAFLQIHLHNHQPYYSDPIFVVKQELDTSILALYMHQIRLQVYS